MSLLHVGTSGWAYATWKPDFYPPKQPAKKFLEYYATQLNSVEVNYSFRATLTEKLLDGWIAATPAGFLFSIKANQAITHIRRLKNAEAETERFLSSLAPLQRAERLGTVLFQLPPFLKADAALLDSFVALLPSGVRYAFEFRHESWLTEESFARLRSRNIALCVAESEKLVVPDVATANFRYYRFRQGTYNAEERRAIRDRVGNGPAAESVFVYFKHEDSPAGALYGRELLTSQ
jgi:uncharacterized protein YecE (DUF72 family)